MKKLIVFFIPLLFLIACGPNKQELAQKQAVIDSLKNENASLQNESLEKIKKDSIAKAEAFEKAIRDSLAAVRTQDSLAALKPKVVNNGGKATDNKYGSFTDSRDSKTYKTVKIGNQTWMAENLAYKASSGCWAYDNNQSNVATYGYLYDWSTAKTVCPTGWHVPTDAEWTTLTTYLDGESVAGGKLKEIGTTHWISPNEEATNETGFTALPGGNRYLDGTFSNIGCDGYWWSATESYANSAWHRSMYCNYGDVSRNYSSKEVGFSVRCVRDF